MSRAIAGAHQMNGTHCFSAALPPFLRLHARGVFRDNRLPTRPVQSLSSAAPQCPVHVLRQEVLLNIGKSLRDNAAATAAVLPAASNLMQSRRILAVINAGKAGLH